MTDFLLNLAIDVAIGLIAFVVAEPYAVLSAGLLGVCMVLVGLLAVQRRNVIWLRGRRDHFRDELTALRDWADGVRAADERLAAREEVADIVARDPMSVEAAQKRAEVLYLTALSALPSFEGDR